MTEPTESLIDATYDALIVMNIVSQRLSEGEVSDKEASDMAWLIGSTKRRLEPVVEALEGYGDGNGSAASAAKPDLAELGSEVLALYERFRQRQRDVTQISTSSKDH